MLCLTDKNFQAEAKYASLPVVVMFYAAWCGKCAMMKPIVEDLEDLYRDKVKFCEVEVEKSKALAKEYAADDIVPVFVFFKDHMYLGSIKGMMEAATFQQQLQEIFGVKPQR